MRGPRSGSRPARIARRGVALLGLVSLVAIPALPPQGPVLLDVVLPVPGAPAGLGGFELLVRFPPEIAVAETFRVLLNGADVTDELTTGENGSHGRLVGLLPGDNRLRLEIFGRVPWATDHLFEQSRELPVRMRPPLDLDRG